MFEIALRFVTSDDPSSEMIRLQAGVAMPFTPSHVEALSRDGRFYTGAHSNGGIEERAIGYDANEPGLKECFVKIEVSEGQHNAFHDYLESKIGEPYDFEAILGFVDPAQSLHEANHAICSALMVMCLRAAPSGGAAVFPWPLTVPAHHVSPRDLFLVMSTYVEIAH